MITPLLLLWVCASGVLLAVRLDPSATRRTDTLALGAVVGLALFSGLGFVLGWVFGLSPATVILAALLTSGIGRLRGAGISEIRKTWERSMRPTLGVTLLTLATLIAVTRISDRALFETSQGIFTADRHNFGDLPFHMAISAGFAYGDNFPPDHPELAGVPLTYPFLCDLLSGMLLEAGGSWRDAFFWPTLILGLSVVVALVRFGEAVTLSRTLGRVGASLTLLSGGFGFASLTSLDRLSRWWTQGPDLTMNDAGFRYANFVTTMFIPQRSILFGWPLLFFALALLVEALRDDPPPEGEASRSGLWLRAGVIASFLPLVHSHSFAVLGWAFLFLSFRAGARTSLAFLRGVTPLAAVAVVFMLTHNSLSTGRFFAWQPGFDGGASGPLRYWLMNGGLFYPLVAIGIFRASAPSSRVFLALPFAALFAMANLFRLSPWIWDNMKFLAPAHAGLAPFAALALTAAWRRGPAGRAGAVALFVVAVLSGTLDLSKVALAGGEYGIFSRQDLLFAEKVRQATPADTTILTAPTHNHPVLLSGRRVFLGYEGHLWSQGLDYAARKPMAQALFQGLPQPPADPLVPRVGAIALTPAEGPSLVPPGALHALPSLVDSPYRLVKVQ